MATLLISDLHLTAERPEVLGLFRRFVEERAAGAEAVYIIGDLFEAWLGDDLLLPGYDQALSLLRELTGRGVPVFVMHGNRDFLLGDGFERDTGCRLVPEGTQVELAGEPALLLHGDSLCTDDIAYQQLRQVLRNPAWAADFTSKPAEERIALARELREKSSEAASGKDYAIMDVNAEAVRAAFRETRVGRIIHGHTHRPAVHHLEVDGRRCERLVLGDWSNHAQIVECDADGCRLERFA